MTKLQKTNRFLNKTCLVNTYLDDIKVYVIDLNQTDFNFRKAQEEGKHGKIKKEAEKLGTIYTLAEFQASINDDTLGTANCFIYIE